MPRLNPNRRSLRKRSRQTDQSGSRAKASLTPVPQKIKILREKDYRTHHIGRVGDGNQFMGFVVGVPAIEGSAKKSSRRTKVKWYAVLHRFDASGNHLGTEASHLGTREFAWELGDVDAKLEKMIAKLGRVKYCDVAVKLFSVRVNGHIFGLVDASEPDENYQRIDLLPNNLAFFPPWDGTYST